MTVCLFQEHGYQFCEKLLASCWDISLNVSVNSLLCQPVSLFAACIASASARALSLGVHFEAFFLGEEKHDFGRNAQKKQDAEKERETIPFQELYIVYPGGKLDRPTNQHSPLPSNVILA